MARAYGQPHSASEPGADLEAAVLEVLEAARRAHYEDFEDGFDSLFGSALSALIPRYGSSGVQAIGNALLSGSFHSEVVEQSLRTLGSYTDAVTLGARIGVLVANLGSLSPRTRYGAAIGLSDAAPAAVGEILKEALAVEPEPIVQKVMGKLAAR